MSKDSNPDQPDPRVAKDAAAVRDLIQQLADDPKLRGLAVVAVRADLPPMVAWCGSDGHAFELLGAVEFCKRGISDKIIGAATDITGMLPWRPKIEALDG